MANPEILSSSSFSYRWTFHVFLSFRRDTRYGFTGHLYKALTDRGIHTFIDDEELPIGDEITPALVKAIQDSRIAIIVFSQNYASSSFCLNELSTIMECVKAQGRLVLPIFYDVDPSEVRHHKKGSNYGEALAKHEKRFDMDKVSKWRMALRDAANLSGGHFKKEGEYEYKFIEKIVEEVSTKIKRVPLPVADYPVGLENHVLRVNSLLEVGSVDEVHMVGIHGIGGIGKTTLASEVYNIIADNFEGLCFLENVRENSNKHGLHSLQKILISKLVGDKKIQLTGVKQGTTIIQERLQRKKVLIILDDVDKHEQLDAIVGKPDWFGPGSRIVVTTRDTHLLASHGVQKTYEVKELNEADALELLTWKAFKTDQVSPSYLDILNRAVTYACGLPLALEVIGSNLFGKSIQEWESALNGYARIPDGDIHKILKVSFDALKEDERSIFLDIACCFKGYYKTEVEEILHAHYSTNMEYHIGVLVDKSLIKLGQCGEVTMHDLIEDMGKEIVRQKSPKEPGERSRLWFLEDIVQVLEDNTGTSAIEVIHLNPPLRAKEENLVVEWDGEAFEKMKNLKTLIIKNTEFSEGPKHLPNSLRVLEWQRYPSHDLPSNFCPKKLLILKLPEWCVTTFKLAVSSKKFVNMRVLKFDWCEYLTELPDLSGVPNLEKLSFENCWNLTTVHPSIGFLDKLKILSAEGCIELRNFPPMVKLTSLEEFHVSNCSRLEKFPEILGKMENLEYLDLEFTGIKEFPFSIRNLTRLQRLSITLFRYPQTRLQSNVMSLEQNVITIYGWEGVPLQRLDEVEENVTATLSSNLESLSLCDCKFSDEAFLIGVTLFAKVKELDLSYSDITFLPACIKEFRFLWKLKLDGCFYLREIRGVPPNLKHFSATHCFSLTLSCTNMLLNQELHEAGNTKFVLPGTRVPEWFEHRTRGSSISFWFRNSFPPIALCIVTGSGAHSIDFEPMVIINGQEYFTNCFSLNNVGQHLYLFDLQKRLYNFEALFPNEWNHAEVSITSYMDGLITDAKEVGIHVFKQKYSMEDIRFTDPYV